ncbi:MAG: InlB B-repeat-containing protein, partial [Lachnospiraceae bacterium]|nr:InlB B-repeat-containing protein [Lachnospiraceae bacterium]
MKRYLKKGIAFLIMAVFLLQTIVFTPVMSVTTFADTGEATVSEQTPEVENGETDVDIDAPSEDPPGETSQEEADADIASSENDAGEVPEAADTPAPEDARPNGEGGAADKADAEIAAEAELVKPAGDAEVQGDDDAEPVRAANVAKIGETEYATLQEAVNAAQGMTGDVTITVLSDVAEKVTVQQQRNLNLTIDGNSKTISGQFLLDGGGFYGDDTLTITNFKFVYNSEVAQTASFVDVLTSSTLGRLSDTHNVTVIDSSFEGAYPTVSTVAVSAGSGTQNRNFVLSNLTAKNMHSLAQLRAVNGITIEDCALTDSHNGINITGDCGTVSITGTIIEGDGYALRLQGATSATSTIATLSNNSFSGESEGLIFKTGTAIIQSGEYVGPVTKESAASVNISGGKFIDKDGNKVDVSNYLSSDLEQDDRGVVIAKQLYIVSVTPDELIYNGKDQKTSITAVTVTYGNGGEPVDSSNYDVSWKNANGEAVTELKNVGLYTVVVTGKGEYAGKSGELKDALAIGRASIANYEVVIADAVFTGFPITPTVTFKDGFGRVVDGVTYDISSITNNTNVGQASVNLSGTENYIGSANGRFNITAADFADVVVTLEYDSIVANGSAKYEPEVTAKLGEYTLIEGTDYTVAYTNNEAPGTATVTLTPAGANITGSAKTAEFEIKAAVAKIGDKYYETLNEAVAASVTGDTLEILKAGEYTLPNIPNNITVEGKVDGVVFKHTSSGSVCSIPNGITFKDVTFNFGNVNYNGFQHPGTINMENCTINGRLTSYGEMNFTECTFNAPGTDASGITSKDYSMWAYAGNLTYTNCTFNGAGKFINVYNESSTTRYKITATGCEFNSTVSNKAAFNVKETCLDNGNVLQYTVNLSNCTTNENFPAASESGALTVISGLVQVDDRVAGGTMDGGEIVVNVDGEQVYITPKIARVAAIGDEQFVSLQAALDAAHEMTGDVTVTLLADISGYSIVRQKEGLNLTIDGAGKKVDGQIIVYGEGRSAGTETLTIKSVNFEGDKTNFYAGTDAFILVPKPADITGLPGTYNYAHNITVTYCTFKSTSSELDVVGFKVTSKAGAYNVAFDNIDVATNLHSIAQLTGTTGGRFNSVSSNDSDSFVNIDGGTGDFTFTNCSFESCVNDGYGIRIKGGSSAVVYLDETNGIEANDALVLGKNDAPSGKFVVTGGLYKGNLADKMTTEGTGKFEISGGFFSVAPTLKQCAEGYYPIASGEEELPYTVGAAIALVDGLGYQNFPEAVTASNNGEKVIKLLANIDEAYTLTNGSIQVELNGKTLTVNVSEGYVLKTSETDGITTYTAAIAVAKIGDVLYATLADAVAAAQSGDTIVMITDSTETETAVVNTNITIDLNGKTINSTVEPRAIQINHEGALTIEDGATGGKFIAARRAITLCGGKLTVNSGEIRSQGYLIDANYDIPGDMKTVAKYDCEIVINGGTLHSVSSTIAVSGNGKLVKLTINDGELLTDNGCVITSNFHYPDQEIVINGGTLKNLNKNNCAIYMPSIGKVTINGGYIEGDQAIDMRHGYLTITGGTLVGSVSNAVMIYSYCYGRNDPWSQADREYGVQTPEVSITGGNFYSTDGAEVITVYQGSTTTGGVTYTGGIVEDFITGGYFNNSPAEKYCGTDAEGNYLYPINNTDEATMAEYPYTVGAAVAAVEGIGYMTFTDAVAAANNGEKVITLLANITDAYTMSVGETLKVQKDGKSLTVKAPEGPYVLKSSVSSGVTTYTIAEADIEFTNANGVVSYKAFSSSVISATGTYKLLKDVTATARIAPGILASNITLDLNGHTLTSTATDCAILLSRSGSESSHKTFNIVDTSENKGGKVVVNPAANLAIQVSGKYNDVTIGEGVTLDGGCVALLGENQTLTVNGTINGGADFAIATNGSTTKNATININEGAVITSDITAIYLPGTGTTTISGGSITGATAVFQKSGTLNITGGTFKATGEAAEFVHNPNGTSKTGDCIVVENCDYPGGAPVTSISGGIFESVNGKTISSYAQDGYEPTAHFVTDGRFVGNNIDYNTIPEGKTLGLLEDGYYHIVDAVASITRNGQTTLFDTLEAAVAAAVDGDTIELLKNTSGNGIIAPQGKFATGLTIDFKGFTYDFSGKGVGSTGTEYNGFQLLMGNTITFKNGTITATSEDAGFLIQNYSNLTLDNMTIDGTNVWGGYVMSNNNGNVVIKDTTINAKAGDFAFDVCRYSSYPLVSVTVEGSSVINGNIEISASGNDAKDGFSLALNGGTYTGAIVLDPSAATAMIATPDKVSITKDKTVKIAAPADYKWVELNETTDKLAKKDYVAQIGEVKFESVAEAIAASAANDTIKLLVNTSENVVVEGGKKFTLDLNGKTLTGYIDIYDADVTIANGKMAGTIYANGLASGKTGSVTIASDATVESSYGIILYQAADNTGNGQTININGTVNGIVWVMGNITSGNSVINVNNGAKITGDDVGIALNGVATVNVNDGATVKGISATGTGIEVRAGTLNVTGGTIIGEGTTTVVNPNGSGTTTAGVAIAVAQHNTALPVSVNISGGTFTGAAAFYESNPQGNSADAIGTVNIAVTGGTFNGNFYSEDKEAFVTSALFDRDVDDKYAVAGSIVIPVDNNMYGIGVLAITVDSAANKATVTATADTITVNAAFIPADANVKITAVKDTVLLAIAEKLIKGGMALGSDITLGLSIVKTSGTTEKVVYEVKLVATNGANTEVIANEDLTEGAEFTFDLDASDLGLSAGNYVTLTHVGFADETKLVKLTDTQKVSVTTTHFSTFEITPYDAVAQIGDTPYPTLEAAVAAAKAGDTVELLKDASGAGIFVGANAGKNITIDLGGHKYTVSGPAVGSTGTATQGFHLEMGNTITIKNGTISSTADSGVLMLVQNYCDLTLDGVTLDGTNLPGSNRYVLSNNCGNVVIKDTTINAKSGDFAFDVCRYASYPSVKVTVEGSSVINGNIEVSASANDAKDGIGLALNGGTLNGTVVIDPSAGAALAATPEKVVITKAKDFEAPVSKDYKWVKLNDTTDILVPKEYVAQIGTEKYETLAEAAAAAKDGDTIQMIADSTQESYVEFPAGMNLTLDLNGTTITSAGGGLDVYGNLTITDTSAEKAGKIIAVRQGVYVNNGASVTMEAGTIQAGYYGFRTEANTTLTINGGNIVGAGNGIYNEGTTTMNGGTIDVVGMGVNNVGTFTINNGSIDGDELGIYAHGSSTTNVAGGTVNCTDGFAISTNGTGDTASADHSFNAVVNISGGTVTSDNESAIYIPAGTFNITGGTITGATGIFMRGGALNVPADSTAVINGTGAAADPGYAGSGDGASSTGEALTIVASGYPAGLSNENVNIAGGTFVSANAEAVGSYATEGNTAIGEFISGGKYSSEPKAEYIVPGKAATLSGEYWIIVDEMKVTFDANGGNFGKDDNDELILTKVVAVPKGETIPTEEITDSVKEGYNFLGWFAPNAEEAFDFTTPITADLTLTAKWQIKTYTITWKVEDKTKTETYEHGQTPVYKGTTPVKESDAQYTYTFKEWTPEIVPATADATYTAVFTPAIRSYTIKFVNYDGEVLQTSTVEYGQMPAYTGATPTRPADAESSYEFKGWNPAIAEVTGDATYVATYKPVLNVAKIGETYYTSLAAAVAAAQSGDTVELLVDHTGTGIFLGAGDKNITIDLGGHTFTCSEAVGSSGTKTQALHLEKGNTVILKNGTVTCTADSGVKMLVQNYADLTLENVTLDGSNLTGNGTYVLSNNCGNVVIGNGTTINAKEGGYAFDVCVTNYYPEGTTVTVNEGAVINGDVQYDVWGSVPAENKASLVINGGTFNGTFDVEAALAEDAKTHIEINGGAFKDDTGNAYKVPEGKKLVQSADGYYRLESVFTVTFNADGGTPAPEAQEVVNGQKAAKPADPEKTGYTFGGWYAEGDDDAFNFNMPITADITLTAKWTVNQYTITFDTAGGSAIDPITQDYNTAVTAPADPTKDGYIFAGWDKEIPATMPAENITITATWTQAVAKIGDTFYQTLAAAIEAAQSGETIELLKDVTENVTFPAGKEVTLDLAGHSVTNAENLNTVEIEGKLTVKDSAEGGKIVSTSACGICVVGGELVFESGAVEAQEMAVLFIDAGKGTINGGTFTAHDNAVLGSNGTAGRGGNAVTVNGGEFIGTIQTPGYVACGIYAANNDTWTINGGKFDITGGAGIVARAGSVVIPETSTVEITTTGNATGKVGDSRVVVPCAALVFDSEAAYPGMTADSAITAAGGTFRSESSSVATVGDADRIVINGGAYSDDSGNSAKVPEGKSLMLCDDGLYRLDGLFTVTFDTDGGTPVPEAQKVANGQKATKPAEPEKAGYTFVGWYAEGDDDAFNFNIPITADIKLTARWTANTDTVYTVTHYFEEFDGTFEELESERLHGVTDTYATAEAITIEGFTFDPTVEGTLLNGQITGDGQLVLKLYYTRNSHNVIYEYVDAPADATPVPAAKSYKFEEEVTVADASAFTATGYTFNGWDKTGTFDMPDEDVVIKGTWTINTYTITFESNGGTDVAPITVEYNAAATAPADPTKDGCIFAGWYLGDNVYDFATPVTGNITLTAHWTQAVAKIGNTLYASLAEAVAAAQAGETVELLVDTKVESITVDKKITIDLGGHEVSSDGIEIFSVTSTGDLTITGNGKITGPANGQNFDGKSLIVVDGGKLTVENGTLTATGSGSDGMYGVYVLGGGTAIFGNEEGGPTITSHFAAIGTNNTTAPATIVVNGGTYTANAVPANNEWWSYFCAPVYAAAAGSFTLNGGTFNGYYGISTRYANVEQDVDISGTVTFNASSGTDVFVDEQTGTAGAADREIVSTLNTRTVPEGYTWVAREDGRYILKKLFKVTFVEEDGETVITSAEYAEGTAWNDVVQPAAPAKEGYTFVEWVVVPETITEDVTVKATYKINEYTVTFDAGGAEAYSTATVEHGQTVAKPADPTKDGYIFSGWLLNGEAYDFTTPVTGNITLTAAWTQAVARIDDVLYASLKEAVAAAHAGDTVTLLVDTTDDEIVVDKELTIDLDGHTVTSTKPGLLEVTKNGDLTITGNGRLEGPGFGDQFDGNAVIYVDGGTLFFNDGELVATGAGSDGMYGVYVLNGGTAVFGTEENGPKITAHFAAIGANNTTAPVSILVNGGQYTSTASPDGAWWSIYCAAVYAPGAGDYQLKGGTFKGYYGIASIYANVDQDIDISKYVVFRNTSGIDVFVDERTGSAGATDKNVVSDLNSYTIPEGYTWVAREDGRYILKKLYTITFVDEDGTTVLQSGQVPEGETPVYTGETPTKTGDAQFSYEFRGWTPDIVPVTGDATYKAEYTELVNEYTITFVDEDGTTVLQSGKVLYGETPVYTGETPTKEADAQYTYSFKGWTPEIAEVTGDATYTAVYEQTVNKYTIKFVDEDGSTVLQSSEVAFGETPVYTGDEPTKEATAQYSYTFAGWTPEIAEVTGEATYTATYTEKVREYTIKFVNYDDSLLQSSEVAFGETPVYTGDTPVKAATAEYTYTFAGWTPDITEVNGEATYKAVFTESANVYSLVFYLTEGDPYYETELAYGAPIVVPENPTMDGRTFLGWTPEVPATMPAQNTSFTAVWASTVWELTLPFTPGTLTETGATFQNLELQFFPADAAIGRPVDGYWVGAQFIAPEALTDANLANATFAMGENGTFSAFAPAVDGKNADGRFYLNAWVLVTEEKVEEALAAG